MFSSGDTQPRTNIPSSATPQLPISWFRRLRYIAFAAQLALFLLAYRSGLQLPYARVAAALFLIVIGEPVVRALHRCSIKYLVSSWVGILVIWDILCLTLILYLSGGPANPFSIVYLVYVVLAAVLLGSVWTWTVCALSTACFSLLFLWHIPVAAFHHHTESGDLSLHLWGMLISYALAAGIIAHFLVRILTEKRQVEARAEELIHAQQRLAAISSITADAAHRLGTPLASLGLVAHELSHLVNSQTVLASEEIKTDVELMRQEVTRCKGILQELCVNSGSIQGEKPQNISIAKILECAIGDNQSLRDSVSCPESDLTRIVELQILPVAMALRALLNNALDANREANSGTKINLTAILEDGKLLLTVSDSGFGMDSTQLRRVKEPFYTTKAEGMGLGVYIAELVAIQLGGSLTFFSERGSGTKAVLSVACSTPDSERIA